MTEETKNAETEAAVDNSIDIEQFMKVDLRVGKILSCERIPKSKKLLKMEVDLGFEKRQILAGMAPYYLPEEMLGRRVVVVANLKPAKLMGIESQGMLLAASPEGEGAVPALITLPEGLPLGSKVR
ncbi:methionine--tRNA ligase subunit beta [Acanthopleuribacter pedis]|uniref:Methionine--tRNA ligase n=1 Tax=Acanthopleuribacter pedis TaxID=442870 RepID=A0A8J7QAR0_9BACT|nr:methionine--tRNA ligase subunit beta [Acanthopleuribacter pedis]MBO1320194.1 methionine--tRNA ligase subunit beta [Acanthopleuribacter pedis]